MTASPDEDPAWDAAWTWVQREFDHETFDDAARAQLAAWLQADPLHRQRYEEATQLWRLAGMVPRRAGDGDGDAGADGENGTDPVPPALPPGRS